MNVYTADISDGAPFYSIPKSLMYFELRHANASWNGPCILFPGRLLHYCGFQDYETECNVMHDPKGQFTWKLKKPTGSDDLTSLSSNPEFSSSMCIESGDHKPGEHGTYVS